MNLALFKCLRNIDVVGRNADGSADRCFIEGKEYLFCFDFKKGSVFIINEVNEYDISKMEYMHRDFELIKTGGFDDFDLDEITMHKYKKLYKNRINYEE